MAAIDYDEAVRVAREAKTQYQWTLGDLADRVEPRYGDQTLQRFAQDIEVEYSTLLDYRRVVRAYPSEQNHGRPQNWSVAKELSTQEDRYELVEENPDMTSKAARKLVTERKAEAPESTCRTDTCAGKPPINPIPGSLRNIKNEWSLLRASRRLKEDLETLESVEELVGKMFADLTEIRRKYH